MRPPLSRRRFLTQLALPAAALTSGCRSTTQPSSGRIMTVLGPIAPPDLGTTLTHEHVVVDFIGADRTSPRRYDPNLAVRTALPHFQHLKTTGVASLVECTPAYIGRNPLVLRRLSEASGIHILTNTGYYGAVDNKYLPPHAHTESADQLAARWLREWEDGISDTGIRPGFIKSGVGNGRLPALHEKLIRAGARVHRRSGLTLAVHTGDGTAALDELRILREEAIAPEALIWVHAQNDPGPVQMKVARAGAWVSLDGISRAPGNTDRYLAFLQNLKSEHLLHRVLLSHDDGWAVEGDGDSGALKLFGNGNPEPYRSLFTDLLPRLRTAGFTPEDIELLLVRNPREAFAIRKRLL